MFPSITFLITNFALLFRRICKHFMQFRPLKQFIKRVPLDNLYRLDLKSLIWNEMCVARQALDYVHANTRDEWLVLGQHCEYTWFFVLVHHVARLFKSQRTLLRISIWLMFHKNIIYFRKHCKELNHLVVKVVNQEG